MVDASGNERVACIFFFIDSPSPDKNDALTDVVQQYLLRNRARKGRTPCYKQPLFGLGANSN